MTSEKKDWLQSGLRRLFTEGRHCDVTIVAQNEKFPCHKAVLAAASGYFDAMFSSAMTEAKSDTVSILELESNTLHYILKYIYGGAPGELITAGNVESVLQAANLFQIIPLKSECENFLIGELSSENCVGFWITGATYACEDLEKVAWRYIMTHFDQVRSSDELLKLQIDDFIKVLRSNDLNTVSEENVCDVALQWIKHDEKSRKVYFAEILKELRLCQISMDYLMDKVFSIKYAFEDDSCTKLLKNAVKYHALPERRHTFDSLKIRPRNTSSIVEMTVVLGKRQSVNGENSTEFIGYNALDKTWYSLCPLPVDLEHEFATCPYGDDIYVSGGTAKPDEMFHFSSKSYKWHEKSKMQHGRFRHSMVPAKSSLYVLGGCNVGTVGPVEKFDISTSSWETVGELLHPVDAASASVLGDKIYVFGGLKTFFSETDVIQCFDMVTNTCTAIGKLPSVQSHIRTTVFRRKIYLAFSNGEIYSFKPNSRTEFVHKVKNFDRRHFGFLKDISSCYLVGGTAMADDEDESYDCCQTSNVIQQVTSDNPEELSLLPSILPVPLEVCGCFSVVIRKKYPLAECEEALEHI